jgi:hypothetical protein
MDINLEALEEAVASREDDSNNRNLCATADAVYGQGMELSIPWTPVL